jgi:hypothetical protein
MKKLLVGLVILSTISSALSQDCMKAYNQKASDRMNLHIGLYATAVVGGAVVSIATPAGWVFLVTFGGASIGSIAYGDAEIPNQFDGIGQALDQSKNGLLNQKAFQKISGKIKHQAYKDYKVVLTDDQISASLNMANNAQAICPLVKIKKNGLEKRAVFNQRALVKYVSDQASHGTSEATIVTLNDEEEML